MSETPFWSESKEVLMERLQTRKQGLTAQEAAKRNLESKLHRLTQKESKSFLRLLWSQFKSPITLLMAVSSILSLFLGETTEGLLILIILGLSGLLGFWQEHRAANTILSLLSLLKIKVQLIRDGEVKVIAIDEVVPGDIVKLEAGCAVPGDALILESQNLVVRSRLQR